MNLPTTIAALVAAQNSSDSQAYADCFSETAVVFDEGKTHTGKAAIREWIEKANRQYKAVMEPLEYSPDDQALKAEISGTFDGSPIVLNYHLEMKDGKIQMLKIV